MGIKMMKTNISINKLFSSYIYSIFLIIEKLAKKTSPAALFCVNRSRKLIAPTKMEKLAPQHY